jgi:hypothetical protein
MYDTVWWRGTVQAWELLMALCFGDWAPLTWLVAAGLLYSSWRRRQRRLRRGSGPGLSKLAGGSASWGAGGALPGGGGGVGGLPGGAVSSSRLRQLSSWWGGGGKKTRQADGVLRDLDV